MCRSSSVIPKVNHLWLVLMNVFVWQSFLPVSFNCVFQLHPYFLNCIQILVFVTPTACVSSLPIFELYAELYDDEYCFNLLLECNGGRLHTVC